MTHRMTIVLSLLVAVGCASSGNDVKLTHSKGEPDPKGDPRPSHAKGDLEHLSLAIKQLDAEKLPKLTVTSPAFAPNTPMSATYSDYGERSSPPLKIAGVPANAKSLLIICEDPDAMEPKPFVHWLLWNVPPDNTTLRTALPGTGQIRELMNAKQGTNSFGSVGYYGPHPPAGDPPHHYHFQVFALDTLLDVEQRATKPQVIDAAKGHVIAAGEIVGTFAKEK